MDRKTIRAVLSILRETDGGLERKDLFGLTCHGLLDLCFQQLTHREVIIEQPTHEPCCFLDWTAHNRAKFGLQKICLVEGSRYNIVGAPSS